jgi:hypothetical protein
LDFYPDPVNVPNGPKVKSSSKEDFSFFFVAKKVTKGKKIDNKELEST